MRLVVVRAKRHQFPVADCSPSKQHPQETKASLCKLCHFSSFLFFMCLIDFDSYSSTSHGFFSHTHWLCSDVEQDFWYTTFFDDRSWPNAFVIWNQPFLYDGSLVGFDDLARLVWHYDLQSETVFCRAWMSYGNC